MTNEKSYKELCIQMDEELATITDDFEKLMEQIKWNSIISKQWEKERKEKNSLTIEQIREKFVGKKSGFHSELDGYQKRVVKEDEEGFYIKWFGDKMVVEYNAVYGKMEMKYIR